MPKSLNTDPQSLAHFFTQIKYSVHDYISTIFKYPYKERFITYHEIY